MKWLRIWPVDQQLIDLLRSSTTEQVPPTKKEQIRRAYITEYEELAQAWSPPSASAAPGGMFRVFLGAAVAAVIVVLIGMGATAASAAALPGRSFYGLSKAVDRVRLAIAITPNNRARIAADIAVERQKKVSQLNQDQATLEIRAQAQVDANVALNRALVAVFAAQEKSQRATNDITAPRKKTVSVNKTGQALERVRELRNNDREITTVQVLTKATATIDGKKTLVTVKMGKQTSKFNVAANNESDIVAAISQRTGVSVPLVWKVLVIQKSTKKKNVSKKVISNIPPQKNQELADNGNQKISESATVPQPEIVVTIDAHRSRAHIEVTSGNERQAWDINTAATTAIALNIATRTGLAVSDIQSVWKMNASTGQ